MILNHESTDIAWFAMLLFAPMAAFLACMIFAQVLKFSTLEDGNERGPIA